MKIELRGVSKFFNGTRQIAALGKTDLTIASGEFVCIIGPSGCGKSTLLALITGLDAPSTGSVLADGAPVTGTDPSRILMFQDGALFPWLTVQQNVEFGLRFTGMTSAERHARARELLRMVHLERFAGARIHELSGGMRQRVSLARAIAVDPAVLLLDEPFAALDAMTRGILHTELQEIQASTKKTIVFVTHNVREAVVLGDRVLVMSPHPGTIVAEHRVTLPRPRMIDHPATSELARRISADVTLGHEERQLATA